MKVLILTVKSGWVLQKISERIVAADPEHFAIGHVTPERVEIPSGEYDATFSVDVQCVWHPVFRQIWPKAKHLGFLTHLDKDADESFRPTWDSLDGMVFMASRYQWRAISRGWYPAERTALIRPGEVSQIALHPLSLGVVQRGGHVGKGSEFLPAVLQALPDYVRKSITLLICGSGWPTDQMWHGVFTEHLPEESYEAMPALYDYLFVPSLWEGGPLGVAESLAAGKPVIAPRVGWVEDLMRDLPKGSWIEYNRGDVSDCVHRICELVDVRIRRRRVVEGMSYKKYATDLLKFIDSIERKV